MLTSPQLKCLELSNDVNEGVAISPALKNPKKHITAVAHSIVVSGLEADDDQCCFNLSKIAGVMGSLILIEELGLRE